MHFFGIRIVDFHPILHQVYRTWVNIEGENLNLLEVRYHEQQRLNWVSYVLHVNLVRGKQLAQVKSCTAC